MNLKTSLSLALILIIGCTSKGTYQESAQEIDSTAVTNAVLQHATFRTDTGAKSMEADVQSIGCFCTRYIDSGAVNYSPGMSYCEDGVKYKCVCTDQSTTGDCYSCSWRSSQGC